MPFPRKPFPRKLLFQAFLGSQGWQQQATFSKVIPGQTYCCKKQQNFCEWAAGAATLGICLIFSNLACSCWRPWKLNALIWHNGQQSLLLWSTIAAWDSHVWNFSGGGGMCGAYALCGSSSCPFPRTTHSTHDRNPEMPFPRPWSLQIQHQWEWFP